MSPRTHHRIGSYAVIAAVAAFVLAPLLAIAYFATAEGAQYLESGTVAAWAEPGRDLTRRLVTFADAERVYATYTQVLALLFPAIFLSAAAVRSTRPTGISAPERWGWRLSLVGYGLFGAGLLLVALLLVGGNTGVAVIDVAFMALMLPGLLIGLVGSTVLGIAFMRAGFQPRTTVWLLALSLPLWFVGSGVLGHNSIGILPLFVAWAAAAWPSKAELAASAAPNAVPAGRN